MTQREKHDHEDQDAEPSTRAPSGERPTDADEPRDQDEEDRGQDV